MSTWRDRCHQAVQNCGCGEVCMFAPTGNAQSVIKDLEDKVQQLEGVIKNKDLLIFELKGQIRNLEDTLGIEYNGS